MIDRSPRPPRRVRQRGAAALAVSVVLLFAMTLVTFYFNRGLLFEQKTSANQYRSTRAFEVAEAGIEWATAMINDTSRINASCVATAGQPNSFRGIYAPAPGTPPNIAPPVNARPGCRITSGVLACSCPPPGTAPSIAAPDPSDPGPSFTVQIDDAGIVDPQAVRVTSYGCINQVAACTDTANTAGDATARVSVILKLKSVLRAAPAAPLTAGGSAKVCGPTFNITNLSTVANGYLVNSGGQLQIGGLYQSGPPDPSCVGGAGQQMDSIPGTPLAYALVPNDTTLSSVSAASESMFAAFFGTTLNQYSNAITTCTITGSSAGNRASNLIAAYDGVQRCRSFWIDGPIQFSGGATLGSATDPVTLVSTYDMQFNGNYQINGVIYSDSADWSSGTSDVRGAVVTRVNYLNNGNGSIVYDPDILGRIRDEGPLVRVPGSWRDF